MLRLSLRRHCIHSYYTACKVSWLRWTKRRCNNLHLVTTINGVTSAPPIRLHVNLAIQWGTFLRLFHRVVSTTTFQHDPTMKTRRGMLLCIHCDYRQLYSSVCPFIRHDCCHSNPLNSHVHSLAQNMSNPPYIAPGDR
jgi:hypothetical protein